MRIPCFPDGDRYSTVHTQITEDVITSRLRTTKMGGGFWDDVWFRAYTVDQSYRSVAIRIRTEPTKDNETFTHQCSYTEPTHFIDEEETIVEMTFVCDNVFGPGEQNGVRYKAETLTDGGEGGGLIVSSSRRDVDKSIVGGRTQIIKSVGRSKADTTGRAGGQLGVFDMYIAPPVVPLDEEDKHIVRNFEYFLEDNKSLFGTRNNPFKPGLFSIRYFSVNHGDALKAEEQAYIYCRAIGHDRLDVDVYTLTSDGHEVPVTYPRLDVRTKYSVSVYYVINYPTADDASKKYVCRARNGDKEKVLRNHRRVRFEQ